MKSVNTAPVATPTATAPVTPVVEPVAEPVAVVAVVAVESLAFNFDEYEKDREAVVSLRRLAEAVQSMEAFLKALPEGAQKITVAALAEVLAPLVPKGKREDLRKTGAAAARYVK